MVPLTMCLLLWAAGIYLREERLQSLLPFRKQAAPWTYWAWRRYENENDPFRVFPCIHFLDHAAQTLRAACSSANTRLVADVANVKALTLPNEDRVIRPPERLVCCNELDRNLANKGSQPSCRSPLSLTVPRRHARAR